MFNFVEKNNYIGEYCFRNCNNNSSSFFYCFDGTN